MAKTKHSTTTRRNIILAGAAALPAFALPALATPLGVLNPPSNDPVFAAIERHRQIEAEYVTACNAVPTTAEADLPTCLTAEDRAGEIGSRSHSELAALVAMTPATVAGCAAVLLYIEQHENEYERNAIFTNHNDEVQIPAHNLLSRIAAVLASQAVQS